MIQNVTIYKGTLAIFYFYKSLPRLSERELLAAAPTPLPWSF